MLTIKLTETDAALVQDVVAELCERYESVESAAFQREAKTYAQELPRGLRAELNGFAAAERDGACVISGLTVDDAAAGPTPAHWKNKPVPSPTLQYDIAFYLMACLLGEPIGWATQQDGYLMHDILPIKGHEHEQIGSGSQEVLTWHTEDAFHPLRTDYLGLACVRNHDAIATTVADIADVSVDGPAAEILRREAFRILPDHSHRAENAHVPAGANGFGDKAAALTNRSREIVERELRSPTAVAVLFGDPDDPYIRIDPHFMQDVQGKTEQEALDVLIRAFDAALTEIILQPGDICFVDNYRMVHGRNAFIPRFDGTDRWLRRLNIARDLRKSRSRRLTAESRTIY
ncbi:guanitoxin biosynthesis L-enduracididine beta-hydroxylase GntD [Nonomuraea zeae]|uniref:Arginine beta-hydroxylase, Fe(II)/alpha-ketoglutarate-dependent n=1 Tax=Nonomuraea zeae TaxID=1642303 RepID=A0A5S4FT38_9ACTN|nr:guanitoxin biosynthesis L-enduracididine beta-hydroxylase GntD [Nonomuraea zeae]TMR23291.1 arginine beta-hydroxylase, Fe(II)/alpha-ketoglutarate-dependent [Nonomuraea zeae]